MSVLNSTLGMLATFFGGRALAGLRDLGSRPSAFAGLGAPTNKQERMLTKALEKLLRDNDGTIRGFARRYGKSAGSGEADDIVQDIRVKILTMARADRNFAANPEIWIKTTVTRQLLMTMLRNAWNAYARSPRVARTDSVEGNDKEGKERTTDIEDLDRGAAYIERSASRRELNAFYARLTKNLDPKRAQQVEHLLKFGAQAMEETTDRIAAGMPSKEARRVAYGKAAVAWNDKHPTAVPYAIYDAAGNPAPDANRFQRDLVVLMNQARKYAAGHAASPVTSSAAVFLSENRIFGESVPGGAEVWLQQSKGKRLVERTPSVFADDKSTRAKKKGKKSKSPGGARSTVAAEVRVEQVAEKAEEIARKRVEQAADKLTMSKSSGGSATVRQSQAVPSAPSFADNIMAIKAVDDENAIAAMSPEARAQALARKATFDADLAARSAETRRAAKAAEAAMEKAKSGVSGLSAFAGLFGAKGKGKRSKLRVTEVRRTVVTVSRRAKKR